MANKNITNNKQIIYPKESYKIIGAAFRTYNNLGYGLRENYYQKAFGQELEKELLKYEREKSIDIQYEDDKIGEYRLDFIIENKIVVELKASYSLGYPYIKQVMSYLKAGNYRLAIIIYFTKNGVKYRRVLNSLFGSNSYIRENSLISEHSYGKN